MRLIILVISAVIIILSACRKEEPQKVDLGYDYFPVKVGHYVIYNIEYIEHDVDLTTQHDTDHYQVKEIIESTFTDPEGRPTQRIERYRRDSADGPWIIKDVWYANRTSTTAEKVEENQRFIKMVFPMKLNKIWDGNAQNTMDAWEYTYKSIDQPNTVSGISFDSTTFIVQRDFRPGFFFHEFVSETYAKHVGLVKKRYKVVTIDQNDTLDVQKGLEYTQTAIDYGME